MLQSCVLASRFMNRFLEITSMGTLNTFVLRNIKSIEMIGVVMRIISFTIVSWLGPESPFMFVWIFNTTDALLLSWCSILKRDKAYTLLNVFWILVGILGITRSSGVL